MSDSGSHHTSERDAQPRADARLSASLPSLIYSEAHCRPAASASLLHEVQHEHTPPRLFSALISDAWMLNAAASAAAAALARSLVGPLHATPAASIAALAASIAASRAPTRRLIQAHRNPVSSAMVDSTVGGSKRDPSSRAGGTSLTLSSKASSSSIASTAAASSGSVSASTTVSEPLHACADNVLSARGARCWDCAWALERRKSSAAGKGGMWAKIDGAVARTSSNATTKPASRHRTSSAGDAVRKCIHRCHSWRRNARMRFTWLMPEPLPLHDPQLGLSLPLTLLSRPLGKPTPPPSPAAVAQPHTNTVVSDTTCSTYQHVPRESVRPSLTSGRVCTLVFAFATGSGIHVGRNGP
mmetsp:Transcript_21758/g.70280  ORF Transcript_21758/g.70280 Transcript_21758/m.70280 type:complete len:357 (-) Transcript_21758:859-1929(-)